VADQIELWPGDVRDRPLVAKACEGADSVFHEAAVASMAKSIEDPAATHAVNVLGTLAVLDAARSAGVRRVVLASSSAVYAADTPPPAREDAPPRPSSPYGLHKRACEEYARLYGELHGLPAVALRYFNVFGPRQDPNGDYAAVIPRFARALLAGQAPRIHGDGAQTRDFVYVEDAVRANLLAADAPGVSGRALNVGTGVETSVAGLAVLLADLTGCRARPEHLPPRAWEARRSAADPEAARTLLGFEPAVSLREGLSRIIAALRAGRGAELEGDAA
jgi:UDP-glucose 4-epimerase